MKQSDMEAIMKLPHDPNRDANVAVAVVSCSKYHELWKPFFMLFRKYWPDCPYTVYLLTDSERCPPPSSESWYSNPLQVQPSGVKTVWVAFDSGWGLNLNTFLAIIPEKRIIMFQEDFLITGRVETQIVQRLCQYAEDNDVSCLRLMPCPGPDKPWKEPFLGKVGDDAEYKISFQLSAWKKDFLERLVAACANPWNLEYHGASLTRGWSDTILSVYRDSDQKAGCVIPYFATAITRGDWEKGALEMLSREGIRVNGARIE